MKGIRLVCAHLLLLVALGADAAAIAVGAAPKGDATAVASRIIKYNFPSCKRVCNAKRLPDGSIRAVCEGTEYRVFTVYSAKEGKMLEVAMDFAAAKSLLDITC